MVCCFVRWEAGKHIKNKLEAAGMRTEGAPAGWAEVYRVFKECKVCFVPHL